MAINSAPAYSIIYDKSLASDPEACLTYAGLCEGFTPMCNTGDMNCDEGSWAEGNGTIFDAIEIGYFNSTTWFKSNKAVAGNSSYECFTKIPKIYQKVTDLGNNKVQLDLALEPFDGASLHPSFVRSGTELNHLYVGRYLAHNISADALYSSSGNTPTVSTTRANFRTYARARGTSYSLLKYYDWDLVNKLYLLAFKNFDSQTALGPGLTKGSLTATGGTDGKSWMCSTSMTGSGSMCFLGIEDWWGNCGQFIDDFYGTSGKYYAGNNTTPTDNTANKTMITSRPTTSASEYYLTCQGTADGFFIVETSGGSDSTGLCDYQYYAPGTTLGIVGGNYAIESDAGAFYLYANNETFYYDSKLSARLTYVD